MRHRHAAFVSISVQDWGINNTLMPVTTGEHCLVAQNSRNHTMDFDASHFLLD